ncbi:jg11927 [Pararge aegeria aegeria]|uniref:Jg11927 protein n=1 Tax=Pararge aegeria aegeria TaxID=348720 RepID=A0A8S4S7I9_9NEOP|nr:jg11927 [Pararge aegeria aegeria]
MGASHSSENLSTLESQNAELETLTGDRSERRSILGSDEPVLLSKISGWLVLPARIHPRASESLSCRSCVRSLYGGGGAAVPLDNEIEGMESTTVFVHALVIINSLLQSTAGLKSQLEELPIITGQAVPPHQLILYDKSGRDVSGVVGPLEEGNELVLVCEVRGGKLLWFYYYFEFNIDYGHNIRNNKPYNRRKETLAN